MRHISKTAIMVFAMAAATTAFAVGCAAPLRTEASSSGIRAAEEVGAAQIVPASLASFAAAKEELDQAKGLAGSNEKERAVSMLSRAEADAETGCRAFGEDAEKAEARAAVDRVRQFRQQTVGRGTIQTVR